MSVARVMLMWLILMSKAGNTEALATATGRSPLMYLKKSFKELTVRLPIERMPSCGYPSVPSMTIMNILLDLYKYISPQLGGTYNVAVATLLIWQEPSVDALKAPALRAALPPQGNER